MSAQVARLHPDTRPVSVEAEQMVLGAVLLDADRIGGVIRAGGADLFEDPVHAAIFKAITSKDREGSLVSPVTVADSLRGDAGLAELGGPGYLARLAGASPAAAAVRGYVQMLADLRQKRRLVDAMAEAQSAITRGDENATIIAGRLEAALMDAAPADGAGPTSMMKAVSVALEQVKAAYEGTDTTGIKSGIDALDKMIGGFFPGELILIGGRPSMGKTGVALSIALNAARAGNGVCIASLEMNPESMAIRALSEQTAHQRLATSYANMRRGEMSDDQVQGVMDAARQVAALPIMFLSRHFSDLGALLAGAKQAQRAMEGQMRLMVVDYAQLLKSNAKGRYEQITEISIALKALAGRLNVPVIALSQLSRAVETRDDKRPMLSDLRESGQLEQDADAVLFCYRDEYYIQRDQPAPDDPVEDHELWRLAMEKSRHRLEIIVAKQRQGEVGTANVFFNPAINRIWEA